MEQALQFRHKLESPKMIDWKIPQKFYWSKSFQMYFLFVLWSYFLEIVWGMMKLLLILTCRYILVFVCDLVTTFQRKYMYKQHYQNWYFNSGLCICHAHYFVIEPLIQKAIFIIFVHVNEEISLEGVLSVHFGLG